MAIDASVHARPAPGEPSVPGDPVAGGRGDAVLAWAHLGGVVLSRGYRALLLTLAVAALTPSLWGWSSSVVRSGSMEPSIGVGDVVVSRPFDPHEAVPLGRVVLFDNPAKPGSHVLMLHRVVERLADGRYATAGDANHGYDSTPITSADVKARAVILVPFIGLPRVWLEQGDVVKLLLWLVLTLGAFGYACRAPWLESTDGPASGSGGEGICRRLRRALARTLT